MSVWVGVGVYTHVYIHIFVKFKYTKRKQRSACKGSYAYECQTIKKSKEKKSRRYV